MRMGSKSFPIKVGQYYGGVQEIPFPSIYLQLMSLLFHLLKSKLPNNFDDVYIIVIRQLVNLVNGLGQAGSGLIQLGLEQRRAKPKWALITPIRSFTNHIYQYFFSNLFLKNFEHILFIFFLIKIREQRLKIIHKYIK